MAVCKSGIPYYTIVTTAAAAAPAHESSSSNAMATLGERGSGGTCKVQPLPDRPTEASSFPNFRNQHMSKTGPGRKKSSCWPLLFFSFPLPCDALAYFFFFWEWNIWWNSSLVATKLTGNSRNQPLTRTSWDVGGLWQVQILAMRCFVVVVVTLFPDWIDRLWVQAQYSGRFKTIYIFRDTVQWCWCELGPAISRQN